MILYGSGDPIEALRLLSPRLVQCHIKDATPSSDPGQTWGDEVVVAAGEVDWPAFVQVLTDAQYAGALVIEREADTQREQDIAAAKTFVVQNST